MQTHPEPFQQIERLIAPLAQSLLVIWRRPIQSLHHRFFMLLFECAMKRPVNGVHLGQGRMRGLQLHEAGDQLIPHRNRHVLQAEGGAEGNLMIAIAVKGCQPVDIVTGGAKPRSAPSFLWVNPYRAQEFVIEILMPVLRITITQFRN